MIQRAQTFYLLSGSVLLIVFLALGLTALDPVGAAYPWFSGVALGLTVVAALVGFGAVPLYRNRKLQAKVTGAALALAVILLLLVGGVVAAFYMGAPTVVPVNPLVLLSIVPILIAAICYRMAQRGIKADDALVKSMDRLR